VAGPLGTVAGTARGNLNDSEDLEASHVGFGKGVHGGLGTRTAQGTRVVVVVGHGGTLVGGCSRKGRVLVALGSYCNWKEVVGSMEEVLGILEAHVFAGCRVLEVQGFLIVGLQVEVCNYYSAFRIGSSGLALAASSFFPLALIFLYSEWLSELGHNHLG